MIFLRIMYMEVSREEISFCIKLYDIFFLAFQSKNIYSDKNIFGIWLFSDDLLHVFKLKSDKKIFEGYAYNIKELFTYPGECDVFDANCSRSP